MVCQHLNERIQKWCFAPCAEMFPFPLFGEATRSVQMALKKENGPIRLLLGPSKLVIFEGP